MSKQCVRIKTKPLLLQKKINMKKTFQCQRAFSSCRFLSPCFLRMCCLRLISFINRFIFFSVGTFDFSASNSGVRFSLVIFTLLWWCPRFPCFRLWRRCLCWALSSLLSCSRRKWEAPFSLWPLRCLLRATCLFGTSAPSAIRTSFFYNENEGLIKMWETIRAMQPHRGRHLLRNKFTVLQAKFAIVEICSVRQ